MMRDLHTLRADSFPAHHVVCHDGTRYRHWAELVSAIAQHNAFLRTQTARRWLLSQAHPWDFLTALLALLQCGKQIIIPPNGQAGTLDRLASQYEAIFDANHPQAPQNTSTALASCDPEAACIDLYTSGSTGEPKRVRKNLRQFETEIATLEAMWGPTLGTATVVASIPHHHVYGLIFRLLWPLLAGRPFDLITSPEPTTLVQRLATLGETVLVSSPALLSRLPELTALDQLNPCPRLIFSSGGPLPFKAAAEFQRQLKQSPVEVFGSTETGGIAWRQQHQGDAWTPLTGVTLSLAPDGALQLHSPHLPDAQPYRMDDGVDLLPEGKFRLLGRLDRVVKIEEKKLSLPEMEAQLLQHPWVQAAALVALTGTRQRVGAVLNLSPEGRQQLQHLGKPGITQQLRKYLARCYEPILLPRQWRLVEQMPFNERGKLPHATLTALFETHHD